MTTTKNLKIAVIGGDGTGPEVTAEALKVLAAVAKLEGISYELKQFDFGGERYLRTGETLPKGAVDELRKFDAIFLGRGRSSRRAAGRPGKRAAARIAISTRSVHQSSPGQTLSRRRDAAARQGAGRHRLRRRPRKH